MNSPTVLIKNAIAVLDGKYVNLDEIERFRYSIYIAEQQKPLPAAIHSESRLPDADDEKAFHFCIRNSNGLVGYARLHYDIDIPSHAIDQLHLGDILESMPKALGFISKLMVDKSLRGKTNAVRLIMGMIEYGRKNFPDAEGAVFHCVPHLVPLYTRMGFRAFGRSFQDQYVGEQTPMVAIFRDVEHFQQCKSPIAGVLENFPPPDAKMNAFRDYFVKTRTFT